MGKISHTRGHRRASRSLRFIRLWGAPVLITGLIIFVVNATLAFNGPAPTGLELYLQSNELIPRTQSVNGYQQVYYTYHDQQVFVTDGTANHMNPKASGRYITWCQNNNTNADTTLYLYDVLTGATLQLSAAGVAGDVSMDGSTVVWSQGINGIRQIMYYDGLSVYQITNGVGNSIRPNFYDGNVVYAQYTGNDTQKPWQIMQYSVTTGQYQTVLSEVDGSRAWPHFDSSGNLKTQFDLQSLTTY